MPLNKFEGEARATVSPVFCAFVRRVKVRSAGGMHFCNIVCATRTPKTATSGAFSARPYHFFFSLEKKNTGNAKRHPRSKNVKKVTALFSSSGFWLMPAKEKS